MQVPIISSLYQAVLGHPFVYERVRPFVVGGVDNGPAWRMLNPGPDDIIVDVGCGTGDGFAHSIRFKEYHGFDTDPIALRYALKRTAGIENVRFVERRVETSDLQEIKPTHVMMCGLLHHISDDDALSLLSMLAKSPGLKRVTAVDPTFLPGHYLNNFFARMDRGRFPRVQEGYAELARRAGFPHVSSSLFRSHPTNGRMTFAMTTLETAKAN